MLLPDFAKYYTRKSSRVCLDAYQGWTPHVLGAGAGLTTTASGLRLLATELCDAVEACSDGLRLDLSGVSFCDCAMLR